MLSDRTRGGGPVFTMDYNVVARRTRTIASPAPPWSAEKDGAARLEPPRHFATEIAEPSIPTATEIRSESRQNAAI